MRARRVRRVLFAALALCGLAGIGLYAASLPATESERQQPVVTVDIPNTTHPADVDPLSHE